MARIAQHVVPDLPHQLRDVTQRGTKKESRQRFGAETLGFSLEITAWQGSSRVPR